MSPSPRLPLPIPTFPVVPSPCRLSFRLWSTGPWRRWGFRSLSAVPGGPCRIDPVLTLSFTLSFRSHPHHTSTFTLGLPPPPTAPHPSGERGLGSESPSRYLRRLSWKSRTPLFLSDWNLKCQKELFSMSRQRKTIAFVLIFILVLYLIKIL